MTTDRLTDDKHCDNPQYCSQGSPRKAPHDNCMAEHHAWLRRSVNSGVTAVLLCLCTHFAQVTWNTVITETVFVFNFCFKKRVSFTCLRNELFEQNRCRITHSHGSARVF